MKLFKFLFSGAFMGVLLTVFAIVIGYATFIENDYDAISAKLIVYNTTWFELLLLLMVVNFAGMIFTKKLYVKSKLNILIIHLALVIIIIGAGITRYIGFEGQMHIRNGKTTNIFRSSDTYLQVQLKQGDQVLKIEEKVLLSPIKNNLFNKTYNWQNNPIKITIADYMPNAEQVLVKAETGVSYITVVMGGADGRHEFSLQKGETKIIHDIGISFSDTTRADVIQIIQKEGALFMRFPQPMNVSTTENKQENFVIEGFNPLTTMSVHTVGNTSFVIKEFVKNGQVQYRPIKDNTQHGTPVIKVKVNEQDVFLSSGKQQVLMAGNTEVTVKVGYIMLELPFYIKLNKFELERYPGSNSPSSFASSVTLIDKINSIERPYRIYMNNILSYGGYRFYQSSYDQDEQGTILSVNHDYWGTVVTYFGYFLLFASLIVSFFTKKTRFSRITQQIKEVHQKRKSLLASFVFFVLSFFATQPLVAQTLDGQNVNKEHAAKFGHLLIQNKAGRIEPINTAASKILMKIYKKTEYNGLSAEQVLLGIITNHEKWMTERLIKVSNPGVQNVLGILDEYASFSDFLDEKGQYKLAKVAEQAYIKKPALRNTYDKALINVDERANVFYMVLNSSMLSIFPIANHPENKWVTPSEFHQMMGHGTTLGDYFENYTKNLNEAKQTGNYQEADKALEAIVNYQQQAGQAVVPGVFKTKLEIFYNKAGLFAKLVPVYLMVGVLMVVLFFWQTFNPSYEFKRVTPVLLGILGLGFLVHTFGLGLRWYIAEHAPWSNGYESMIYISWATILAGFLFMKKSPATIGVSALLSGITLLTAHMSWMNPEITNLVPVLKSYWLTIHVATITASYGFLALGCMLGFLNLCLMIFRNKTNLQRIDLTLKELTLIVEMSLIVGLVFLIIGNFLGGIWANESWGRYWGWDPKETWTLVTIIVYSFTLHMALIPQMKKTFSFNFMAVISFGTVLMTYFGVNYFLSGLHSYAGGDPIQVPEFVYYMLAVIGVVSALAAFNSYKLKAPSIT